MRPRLPKGAVLIAGGGTAGHLVPGLAVAHALVEQGWPAHLVHFVGSERGVETRLVPEAGFALTALPGRGINERRLNLANVKNAFDLVRGIVLGVWLVFRSKPCAVLSLGGYAALPASVGAVLRRLPLVIAEQNAVPSSTNRLLGRFATACAVPFEAVDLPRAVVTGNPVRPEVVEAAAAGATRGWPADRLRVVVFGGSLGARRINRAVWDSVAELDRMGRVFMFHVVGHRDWSDLPPEVADHDWYEAVEYDDDLPSAIASCDLVVSRSGGSTVAELAVIGVASVVVPLPIAIHDHQTRNAEALAEVGATRVVRDADFDAERLVAEIRHHLDSGVADAATAARTVGHPDAARAVAGLVLDVAGSPPGGTTP